MSKLILAYFIVTCLLSFLLIKSDKKNNYLDNKINELNNEIYNLENNNNDIINKLNKKIYNLEKNIEYEKEKLNFITNNTFNTCFEILNPGQFHNNDYIYKFINCAIKNNKKVNILAYPDIDKFNSKLDEGQIKDSLTININNDLSIYIYSSGSSLVNTYQDPQTQLQYKIRFISYFKDSILKDFTKTFVYSNEQRLITSYNPALPNSKLKQEIIKRFKCKSINSNNIEYTC